MSVHFEETLIRHCAATLARHKCGSLFAYAPGPGESLEENLAAVNARLAGRGVQARLMKRRAQGGLIYVYRPDQLATRLAQPEILAFLKERGYAGPALEGALETLARRLGQGEEFPHEIGVFLGYPLVDVLGFIAHGGREFCCLGCWKAYSDAEQARRTFALYHKCREVYLACYRRGFDVARLTVAA